jgi:CubicO group peptidase (beta-lactamase class C family)
VQLDDPLHLTLPDNPDDVFTFNDETLQAGYTIRNLMTLQSLDIVLRGLDVLDEKED